MKKWMLSLMAAALLPALTGAPPESIPLPAAEKTGGMPLRQAITARASARNMGDRKLPDQVLSNLLYAAAGVTRPDGRRSIPTARNLQDLTVYAVLPEGAYEYLPREHALRLCAAGDLRGECGLQQAMHARAAVVLVYVSDRSKLGDLPESDQLFYSGIHAGSALQNVYLSAADQGLATVVCGSVNREALARALKLPETRRVLLTQPLGYAR